MSRVPRSRRFRSLALALLLAALPLAPAAGQDGRTDVIAQTGDAAPDANGTFSSFSAPVLNAGGQAAFRGLLTGTTGGGPTTAASSGATAGR